MRVIAKIDIKGTDVIKSIQFDGVRKVGDPIELALKYFRFSSDEIILNNVVGTLYDRTWLIKFLREVSKKVFIPVAIGGGINSLQQAEEMFKNGADKVIINSHAVENPSFLKELSQQFGNQAVVSSIHAGLFENKYYVFTEMARKRHNLLVSDWIKKVTDLGSGEIVLTSINRDGTFKGLDYALYKENVFDCGLPIVACGGTKNVEDVRNIMNRLPLSGVAISSLFHYNKSTPQEVKKHSENRTIVQRLEDGNLV